MFGDVSWTNSAKKVSEEFENPYSVSLLSEVTKTESFLTAIRDGFYFYQLWRKPASIRLLPERKCGRVIHSHMLLDTRISIPANYTLR